MCPGFMPSDFCLELMPETFELFLSSGAGEIEGADEEDESASAEGDEGNSADVKPPFPPKVYQCMAGQAAQG